MGQAVHRYFIFETAGGFCGIAWNDAGITRFQLPTKSVEATERILLRRVPGAKPGAPTLEVAEAVAAAKRYFEGEEADFSGFRLNLGEQDPLFERIYAAARRIGWGRTTTYGALAKELGAGPEAARDVGQAMAKNPVGADHPLPQGPGGGGQGWWFFRARWVGGQETYARAGGRSRRATATGTAIFRVLGRPARVDGRSTVFKKFWTTPIARRRSTPDESWFEEVRTGLCPLEEGFDARGGERGGTAMKRFRSSET